MNFHVFINFLNKTMFLGRKLRTLDMYDQYISVLVVLRDTPILYEYDSLYNEYD